MSVCNISFSENEALIITDTQVYDGRRPAGFCDRKAWISDTGRFAIVTRGGFLLGEKLASRTVTYTSMDWAEETVTIALSDFTFVGTQGIEITLAGWSDLHDRLRVVRFCIPPGGGPLEFEDLPHGVHLSPCSTPPPPLPAIADEAQMVRMALVQHRVSASWNLNMCIGGVMHLTRVRPAGVTQREVVHYPATAESVHAG